MTTPRRATLPDLTQAPAPGGRPVELMAHPGRAQVFADWLDPAIRDETDPTSAAIRSWTCSLGRISTVLGRTSSRVPRGQLARNRRITAWVRDTLDELERAGGGLADLPFVVHGTTADPRFLDVDVDPSDRSPARCGARPPRPTLCPPRWGTNAACGHG